MKQQIGQQQAADIAATSDLSNTPSPESQPQDAPTRDQAEADAAATNASTQESLKTKITNNFSIFDIKTIKITMKFKKFASK